jgi:predicted transcriptional regulator
MFAKTFIDTPKLLGACSSEVQVDAWVEEVERESVHEFLKRHPGASTAAIARGLGCSVKTVTMHLVLGQGHLFAGKDGRWYPIPR